MTDARRFQQITGLRIIPKEWDYAEERQKYYDDLPMMCARSGLPYHAYRPLPGDGDDIFVMVTYWNASFERLKDRG